jgi:glycosyltransferase, family 2
MQTKGPLVSVIMNCYNSDLFLREAIDSVFEQTYKNWEIVFWDNQSTDRSAEIVKSYRDERIRYFYAPIFTTLYEARNYAVERSSGEYITFLDCDDKWYSHKLERQLAVLVNSEYNLCYSNFFNLYGNKLKKAIHLMQPSGDIFKYQISNYSIGILTAMLKKSAWDEMMVKFDKSLSYPGDFDFFIRFLYKNKAIYIDECLCVYRADNPNSISNTKKLKNIEECKETYLKLEKLFLNNDNRLQFIAYRDKIIRLEAGYYFRDKDFKKARKIIAATKFNSKKSFLAYIATFLPKFFLNYLVKVI